MDNKLLAKIKLVALRLLAQDQPATKPGVTAPSEPTGASSQAGSIAALRRQVKQLSQDVSKLTQELGELQAERARVLEQGNEMVARLNEAKK